MAGSLIALISFIIAFFSTILLVPVFIHIPQHYNIFDNPDGVLKIQKSPPKKGVGFLLRLVFLPLFCAVHQSFSLFTPFFFFY